MKHAVLFLIGFNLVTQVMAAEKLTFGLDRKAEAVRRKSPVVIYLGNDVMAPTSNQEISNLAGYLRAGFSGKQAYKGNEKWFSDAELTSFAALPEADRAFLEKIGNYVATDVSQNTTGTDAVVLREGICRRNPKYRAALVVLRNFRQNGPMSKTRGGFRWEHCGTDVKEDLTSQEAETDISKLDESIYAYPFTEQPLTHAGLLRLLVADIAKTYPPDDYRYLVIVHSPSRGELALAAQYPVPITGLPIEKLRRAVLDARKTFHEEKGTIKKDQGFTQALNAVVKTVTPNAKFDVGTSAKDFVEMFDSVVGASVSAVVLDGNALDVTALKKEKFPRVGTVAYGTNEAPVWRVYEWERLFEYVGVTAKDIEDRLFEIL